MSHTIDKREALLLNWLKQHFDIIEDKLTPVSWDASFRRYFRITAKDFRGIAQTPIIAVDAPPDLENSQPFIGVTQLFVDHQLPVPEIYHSCLEDGFFAIEDFGDQLLINSLNPQSADYLYTRAIDIIHNIQSIQHAQLPQYDHALLYSEMHLFVDWYLKKHKQATLDFANQKIINTTFSFLEQNALQQPQVVVHRDYHSRNIMVLGYDQLGIIDYQDAVKGPITYDLVSLLRDCYIDWPQEKISQWLAYFHSRLPTHYECSLDQLSRWFDLMGIQRHLKASGIFCRLNYRDGKPAYLNDVPRTLNYIINVSEKYSELNEFNQLVRTLV